MSRREEIFKAVEKAPALPVPAARVLQLLQDPDSSMGEIMEVIEYDAALTAEVLRLANSAWFAGPRQIGSLRQAGVLLGTKQIQQLVMASALFPIARHPIKGYDLPAGRLMEHLLAVAMGAEELAKLRDREPPDYTFTAGLLHGVGKIVMGSFVAVDAGQIMRLAREAELTFDAAERQILGTDHAEAGAALLARWQLPDTIIDAVRWHLEPDKAGAGRELADLVHAAVMISIECGIGIGIDGLQYRPCQNTVARLRLKPATTEQATCRMLAGLASLREQKIISPEGN
jgi:putative nucleotidyltransferase with HDIG domain